jgi:hypothetical protein
MAGLVPAIPIGKARPFTLKRGHSPYRDHRHEAGDDKVRANQAFEFFTKWHDPIREKQFPAHPVMH